MRTAREWIHLTVFSLIALLSLSAWPAAAGQTLSEKELSSLLEKETLTQQEHLKLADHYSAEAEQLRANAERHTAVATRYQRAGKLSAKVAKDSQGMQKHCEDLSRSLTGAAKAAQELAASHRAMAAESTH